ncbi:MAG TPA: hypothetical protein VFR63_06730 [Gaiellaceae bacterium]|nr:hypothetical protein [Gaiellaceae bacterium]
MPTVARSLALAGALLLAGCGLGDGDSSPEEEQKITRTDLARMVLPQDEVGGVGSGLEAEEDAGPVANAEAADASLDPDDTAKTLAGAGRVAGHKLYYGSPGLASLKERRGVFLVGTEVELMLDPVYAAQHLNKQMNDFQRLQGQVETAVKLSRVTTFAVSGVGDEAQGLRATASFAGRAMHMTVVGFRRGRIVGVASIVRADRRDTDEETRRLAVRLDARILGVLGGTIDDAAEAARPARAAFAGRERLPALTLRPADVGAAAVADEGRRKGDGYLSHQRTFADVRVGRSHLVLLRAETQVYRSPEAAALAYRLLDTADGRRLYAHAAMESFADESGVKPRKVVIGPLADAGPGAMGVVVSFDVPAGRFRIASVFVRSGRYVQSVTGFCRADSFVPGDLRPLGERARELLVA